MHRHHSDRNTFLGLERIQRTRHAAHVPLILGMRMNNETDRKSGKWNWGKYMQTGENVHYCYAKLLPTKRYDSENNEKHQRNNNNNNRTVWRASTCSVLCWLQIIISQLQPNKWANQIALSGRAETNWMAHTTQATLLSVCTCFLPYIFLFVCCFMKADINVVCLYIHHIILSVENVLGAPPASHTDCVRTCKKRQQPPHAITISTYESSTRNRFH